MTERNTKCMLGDKSKIVVSFLKWVQGSLEREQAVLGVDGLKQDVPLFDCPNEKAVFVCLY